MASMNIDVTTTHDHKFSAHSTNEGVVLKLEVGYETVQIEKMFGPMIFADLRIRADASTCEWIVERSCGFEQMSMEKGDPYDGDGAEIWKEWVRIPGQLREDFHRRGSNHEDRNKARVTFSA